MMGDMNEVLEVKERKCMTIPNLEMERKCLADESNRHRTIIDDQNLRLDDYIKRGSELEIDNRQIPILTNAVEDKARHVGDLENRLSNLMKERDEVACQGMKDSEK